MSEYLLVAIPLVLLALVLLLGFVGCVFHPGGLDVPPVTDYSDATILPHAALVAYWRLNEAAVTDPAVDSKGGHDGSYVDSTTAPGQFPYPDVPGSSAPAPGTLTLGSEGIVGGDTVGGVRTTCMQVDGGYVSVPFDAAINPPAAGGFSIEAWVRVEWTAADPVAFRMVVDCRTVTLPAGTNPKGFALYATPDNHWEVVIGMDAAGPITATSDSAITLPPADMTYLIATYDGPTRTLTLYVDGQQATAPVVPAGTDAYVPNDASDLFIGAGAPYFPLRPPVGPNTAPLTPFRGKIQDVALYGAALSQNEVTTHHENGKANPGS